MAQPCNAGFPLPRERPATRGIRVEFEMRQRRLRSPSMMDLTIKPEPPMKNSARRESARERTAQARRSDRRGGATSVADDRRDRARQADAVGEITKSGWRRWLNRSSATPNQPGQSRANTAGHVPIIVEGSTWAERLFGGRWTTLRRPRVRATSSGEARLPSGEQLLRRRSRTGASAQPDCAWSLGARLRRES